MRFVFLFPILSVIYAVDYQNNFETPSDCAPGTFYDSSHLQCQDCSKIGADTEPSADKSACVCKAGFKKIVDYGGTDTKCESCPEGQTATPDGWGCALCQRPRAPNGTSSTTNACSDTCGLLGPNSFSLWRNSTGSLLSTVNCSVCQPGSRPGSSPSGMQFCEACNPGLDGGTCPCATSNQEQSGGLCFARGSLASNINDQYVVTYGLNNDKVVSAYFQDNLRAAAYMCKTHKNFTACQVLANLCVLTHYSRDTGGGGESACSFYDDAAKAASGSSVPDPWPPWMPFIQYPQDDASTFLTRPSFDVAYSFNKLDPMSTLNFTAAVYSLNGSFLGLKPLTGGLLQLCASDPTVQDAAYRFGRKYRQRCQVSLQKSDDIHFFDIYLIFTNTQSNKLNSFTIPILDLNLVVDKVYVNQLDMSRWQFVRRIFLVDAVTAREKEVPTAVGINSGLPKYIRYAQYIDVVIHLKNTKDGKIYPPYVRIQYADVKVDSINPQLIVAAEFRVSYFMDTTRHEKDLEITMSTLCSFGALWALNRAWSWSRRSGKAAVDFVTIFKFLIYLATTISNIFLIVLVFMCAWLLILYKCQETPVIMMLTAEQEYSFLVYFGMAVALKIIEVINLIAEQVTTKVFFVDWERPRGYIVPRSGETNPEQPPVDTLGVDSGPGKALAPVSIWRTYIVANEWNEFQTYRKTSYVLQLFAMVFFLKILQLENLALIEPGATIWNAPKEYQDTRMSRFAVAAVTYLAFGFFQWFINVFIIERCMVDHFRNFIDLCSISNVSVFVFLYHQFGYYIHGRSVHGHADTNMREMNEMLQRERENMVTQRGLEPNTDQQCFIASFSHKFRDQYDRMLAALQSPNRPESRMASNDPASIQVERQVDVYNQMNHFLASFVDHLLPDNGYIVKDRLFLESLLDMEFQDSSQKGTFHKDPSDCAFTRVFFYGNEWTLLTFDMLIFCITDLIARNFLIAALATFVIFTIIKKFRDLGGKKNIARTCLIDERFLI